MKTSSVNALSVEEDEPFFTPGEPVWALREDGPRHGEMVWDFAALITRKSEAERSVDLADISVTYRADVTTILGILAQPDHPNAISSGVVRKGLAAPTSTISQAFSIFKIITRWAGSRSLATFADWTAADADALLAALEQGSHRPGAEAGVSPSRVRAFITHLRYARSFASALEHPLQFQPWGARTAAEIAGQQKAVENVTPPLPWSVWAPLVAGAWRVVDQFSVDVIAANDAFKELAPEARGVGGWEAFQRWYAAGGVLPLATGFGRTTQARGQPNRRLLCRILRVNNNFLNPANRMYKVRATEILAEMAQDPARSTYGGLITPTVLVTHADGSRTPWISELGLGEREYLMSVLRAACYVLICSLTGTRDSEVQDMERDAVTVADGLNAITSVQTKGRVRNASGQTRTWWAPKPVTKAVEVLNRVSPHPTHLFARDSENAGSYDPSRDIQRLIAFINGDPVTRPGRGRGLGLDPIVDADSNDINATSLRRSLSVYAVTKPGAELGLGIQLGHSAWRLVSGYASDGKQTAISHMDGTRKAILREQAAELLASDTLVAGVPADDIQAFRAQIITDPERAARLADQVADRLHIGLTNDCMFNKSTSGCGPDGPHLADHYCIGDDCANALFRPVHVPLITNTIERIDDVLNGSRGNPDLLDSMRRNRANLARLRRELTTTEDTD